MSANRFLTLEMMVAEFSEMMGTKVCGHLSPFGDELFLGVEINGIRYHRAVELSESDITLTLDEFRARYLVPMEHSIHEAIAEQRSPK